MNSTQLTEPDKAHYPTGYSFPPAAHPLLRQWLKTNLAVSVGAALLLLATIIGVALISAFAWPFTAGWTLYVAAQLVIAFSYRGLENLVHEGAHFNWTRRRWLNDIAVNLLAGLPVLQLVQVFRPQHDLHHRYTGGTADPCLKRFIQVGSIPRTSAKAYLMAVTARFGAYLKGWFKGPTGMNRWSLVLGLGWHAVFVILPMGMLIGFGRAVEYWVLYAVIPFLVPLQILRQHAEFGKHDYASGNTVFAATFSNCGLIHRFLHPCGDQFHLLHHLHCAIPHHHLKEADEWLMAHDPQYAGSRRRHGLLDAPDLVPPIPGNRLEESCSK